MTRRGQDGELDATRSDVREDEPAARATAPGRPSALARADATPGDLAALVEVSPHYYQPGAEVARGGMGRIVRARDRRLGRTVAIKELIDLGADRQLRFEREARITARLAHPAIVNVHEAGRWPSGQPFYAMTFVEGRSLADVLAEERTLDDRLALLPNLIAVVEALAYAHGQGVIHRDLKPANILLGEYGHTVVVDWGLAKEHGAADPVGDTMAADAPADPALTRAGSIIGTPAYMAPEQARGEPMDPRSDIYALGAILYHALAGSPPHDGLTADALVARIAAGEPARPLGERQPGLPDDLTAIVDHAMAPDPAARYPTARELLADLDRFRRGQLVAARRYSTGQLIARWAARHRALLAVGVVAFAVIVATLAASFRTVVAERDAARSARSSAAARANELLLRQAQEHVADDPAQAIAALAELPADADGDVWSRTRLIALAAHLRGLPRVVSDAAEVEVEGIDPDGAVVGRIGKRSVMRWPPDGPPVALLETEDDLLVLVGTPRWLAAAAKDGTIRVLRRGAKVTHTLRGHSAIVFGLAIAEDADRLVSTDLNGEVRIWDLAGLTGSASSGGEPSGLSGLPVRLTIADNGGRFALAHRDKRVTVWDAGRGALARSFALTGDPGFVALSSDGQELAFSDGDAVVRVDLPDGQPRRLSGHDGAVTSGAFTRDGRLVTGGDDHTVRRWGEGEQHDVMHGFAAGIQGLALAGEVIAARARDGSVRVWRSQDEAPRPVLSIAGDGGAVTLELDATGQRLAVGGPRGVRLWELDRGGRTLAEPTIDRLDGLAFFETRALAFDPSGRHLAVAGAETYRVWDLEASGGSEASWTVRRTGRDRLLGVLPAGGEIVVLDVAGRLRGLAAGRAPRTIARSVTGDCALSPNQRVAAFAGPDGALDLIRLTDGERRRLALPGVALGAARFSADGRWLAAAAPGGPVVWDLKDGSRRVLDGATGAQGRLAISPRGGCVVAVGDDGAVHRWLGSASSTLATGVEPVAGLAVRDECSEVAWQTRAGALSRWRAGEVASLAGDARAFAPAPGGELLAIVTTRDTLELVDGTTGAAVTAIGAPAKAGEVAFSPDGRWLAAVVDDAVRVWSLADVPREPDRLASWLRERRGPSSAAAAAR